MLGDAFHDLNPEERAKYDALAEEDKEKKDKELAEWAAAHEEAKSDDDNNDIEMTKKKRRRSKKDPNAPKKASSAYIIFSNERRGAIKAANPDADFGKMVCLSLGIVLRMRGCP